MNLPACYYINHLVRKHSASTPTNKPHPCYSLEVFTYCNRHQPRNGLNFGVLSFKPDFLLSFAGHPSVRIPKCIHSNSSILLTYIITQAQTCCSFSCISASFKMPFSTVITACQQPDNGRFSWDSRPDVGTIPVSL